MILANLSERRSITRTATSLTGSPTTCRDSYDKVETLVTLRTSIRLAGNVSKLIPQVKDKVCSASLFNESKQLLCLDQ